jgi:DNA-binding response OmpR family regulator
MDASCSPSETLCFENVLATIKRTAAVSASGHNDDKMIVEHLGITVDVARHRAFMAEIELELTPTEFRLLHCLIQKPGQVIA